MISEKAKQNIGCYKFDRKSAGFNVYFLNFGIFIKMKLKY